MHTICYRRADPTLGQAGPCAFELRNHELKTTSVSLTSTKCTPWVLVIIDPCPYGFTSDLCNHCSFVLWSGSHQNWHHPEVCFRLQDLTDSRHDPNTRIKKVITPTIMSLKSKKWFDDHSLFSYNLSFFVISERYFFKGEGYNTLVVTIAATVFL
jgi:hypothetical protein